MATGLPVGGTLASQVLSYTPTSADFTVDVFAVDANSNLISLDQSDFTISSFDFQGSQFHFTNQGADLVGQGSAGSYSATFLLDQSGSIRSTDPSDTRLDAAEVFMDKLSRGDEVALLSFTSSSSPPVTEHRDRNGRRFTNDPDGFDAELRRLATTEGGGTPLYDAIITAVNFTVAHASNRNRAVLVFTDGDDTASSASLEDAVRVANNNNVPLYTVALSGSTDLNVLTRLATATGGSLAFAAEARQLISYYGALGRYLSGSAEYYRTRWTGTITGGSFRFGPGGWLRTGVRINTPTARLYAPFRIDFPATSSSTTRSNEDTPGFVFQVFDTRPPPSIWE